MGGSDREEAGAVLGQLRAAVIQARNEEARQRQASLGAEAYDEIFGRLLEGVGEMQQRLLRERKHGDAQWAILARHPQARRLVMIRNDRRLHTWGLYKVLLDRSRSLAGHDARAAEGMAELALAVAGCLDPKEHGEERTADFRAGALAALADAKRRLADRQGAREAFEAAHASLEEGAGDPLERAELEVLRARLLRDFGPAGQAGRSLRRAVKLLRTIGDKRLEKDLLSDEAPHGAAHRRARG